MGYGDDLLITKLASKVKKQFPDRQIVIGNAKNQSAYHSIVYDNNPNISDCRNLEKSKPTHIIDYHPYNRPYICLLYTSPSPRDLSTSRMPSSA